MVDVSEPRWEPSPQSLTPAYTRLGLSTVYGIHLRHFCQLLGLVFNVMIMMMRSDVGVFVRPRVHFISSQVPASACNFGYRSLAYLLHFLFSCNNRRSTRNTAVWTLK